MEFVLYSAECGLGYCFGRILWMIGFDCYRKDSIKYWILCSDIV